MEFWTRSGHVIPGLSHLKEELRYYPSFDGELVIPNMDFFEMNGLIRSFNETPTCMFYVFDMPLAKVSTQTRLAKYMEIFTEKPCPHVHPLKYHIIADRDTVDLFYQRVLNAGHEGVVYKHLRSPYRDGKHWPIQKRVPVQSCECPIVNVVEGKKSFTGMLGAFMVQYEDTIVKIGTGKGMTHDFRRRVWANPEKYIGQDMKVEYKSITPSGSLQSPKYAGIRWDL